jgi:hypothetical protein
LDLQNVISNSNSYQESIWGSFKIVASPSGNHQQNPFCRRLGVPHSQSRCLREEKNVFLMPGVEPQFLFPPLSLVTVLSEWPPIEDVYFAIQTRIAEEKKLSSNFCSGFMPPCIH